MKGDTKVYWVSSDSTLPRWNTHFPNWRTNKSTQPRRGWNDTQKGMLSGIPKSARCVQRFDDSLNSAIRITYRISLRSSSIREPRYPLLRVVLIISYFSSKSFRSDSLIHKVYKGLIWFGIEKIGALEHFPLLRWRERARCFPSVKTHTRVVDLSQRLKHSCFAKVIQTVVRNGFTKVYTWIRCNDPAAGSPTATLLRLLLPLNAQVCIGSHLTRSFTLKRNDPQDSLMHSIGSSDGRCVQRAGT